MSDWIEEYRLRLIRPEHVRAHRWQIAPDEIAAYEALAKVGCGLDELFSSLMAVCQHVAITEIMANNFSDECRKGARRAMTDIIALIAARPCNGPMDVERKIIASILIGDMDRATPLQAAMEAAICRDAAKLMPELTAEEVKSWIAKRRWSNCEN